MTSPAVVNANNNVNVPVNNMNAAKSLVAPVTDAKNRITKKPFGIYITPKTSPVQPERFTGYHTGTDFETFSNELNQEIVVHAICDGKVIVKRWASGYGNVMVESCSLNGQSITVVYGHLSFSGSTSAQSGSSVSAGDPIAVLGAAYSRDTDGERKHLHLGIHKGAEINILGYVQAKGQLIDWLNSENYISF